MAIEGVLARRKCAEKWCASFWDPVPQFSVSLNSEILNFQDFRHSWKVTSSPSGPWTSKWVLGFPQKTRGCRSGGLRRKYILKSPPNKKQKKRETGKPSFFVKMATFCMPFQCFFFMPTHYTVRNWQEEHAQKNMDPGRATPKKENAPYGN